MQRAIAMKCCASLAVAGIALHLGSATAAELPLWELGLGVGDVNFPAYRGSSERQNFLLPVPYVIYRGDFLRADRDGLRGIFFDSDRIEINLSASASTPVDSHDIHLRQDMPDLKPTVELGPSLDVHLWHSDNRRYALDLRVPVRYAATVESSPRSAGWQFTPRLNVDIADAFGLPGWNLGLLTGPIYGSAQQHDYFYSVAPQYATPQRPAYDAAGGYAGWQFLGAVSRRFDDFWVGAFIRYDTLAGAVFADSPLVTDERYIAAGIAVAWIIGESDTRVHEDN